MSCNRPFTCTVCSIDFKLKHNLQRHMRDHQEEKIFLCPECGHTSKRKDNMQRHQRTAHAPSPSVEPSPGPSSNPDIQRGATCPYCHRVFVRPDNVSRHIRDHCPVLRRGDAGPNATTSASITTPVTIQPADSPVPSILSSSSTDISDIEEDPEPIPNNLASQNFEEIESGFRGRLKTYRLREPSISDNPLPVFLTNIFEDIVFLICRVLQYVPAIKVNLWIECQFVNVHGEICLRNFKTRNISVLRNDNVENICGEFFEKLITEKEACEMKGSGWSFVRVLNMEVRVNVYRPLKGSSYIPLPKSIADRKVIINVLNQDQRCFQYAVLTKYIDNPNHTQLRAADFTPQLCDRINLDFSDLEFPVRLDKIIKFEERNGVSVNVYGLDLEKVKNKRTSQYEPRYIIYPLRIIKRELENHFDLLYLTDGDRCHFTYISNFERLVRSQLTKHKGSIYVCKRCFAHFDNQPNKLNLSGLQRLDEHRRYCYDHAPLRTDIAERKKISFEHHERSQRSRFTVYADFESMLVPYDGEQPLNPTPTVAPPAWDPATSRPGLPHHRHHGDTLSSSNVNTKNVHIPYAYSYYICDSHRNVEEGDVNDEDIHTCDTFSRLRLYSGENVAEHFMLSLREDINTIGRILYGQRQPGDPPRLTMNEESEFQSETMCYICQQEFTSEDIKVRDHQHSPPYRYRGAAHQSCNLRFKEQDSVNVYFHNLSNYDAHFIVRALGIDEGEVNVLANNEEKYISFTKKFDFLNAGRHNRLRVRFVDSYRFLAKSLASLAALLPVEKMKILQARHTDLEEFQLLRRKGVFPYKHITSLEVLQEDTLPPIETFENISADDYAHAKRVWDLFGCVNLEDYSNIYLETDVLLLADIFEGFRDMCLEHYNLDPAHYLTLPSYAWDVMLKETNVTLDTLQDIDQYLFFEKGIRGGLTQCVTRHVVANNKYTRGDDIESDEDTFLMYYDANNLYGWAMSEPLPYGDFGWLSQDEKDDLQQNNIMELPADGEYGYVLEVDLEYPCDSALHDRHRDLPFCPEVIKAPAAQLPYGPDVLLNSGVGKSTKLMATLTDKTEYVIHFRYLQQALENGLCIRHIHRVLRFKQSAWLKPYVALNTRLRQSAKNKFEQELFKLMVNAVYGMSLQNVRKHKNVKICTSRKIYIKNVAKSNFSDRVWFDENLALLNMAKTRVVLDKPVYVGMCILDHSKWWMYGFHYRMIDRYGLNKIRMTYMDTDGIDMDRWDMIQHKEEFDTSNYPQNHPCYDASNARVLGKFKDEAGGHVMTEFIGLMDKLYCMTFLQTSDNHNDDNCGPPPIKKVKVINKTVEQYDLTVDKYRSCLQNHTAKNTEIKKAKGINKAVVQRDLTVDDYRSCLRNHTVKCTENERFMSRRHILYTIVVRKLSLAPFDDKRYVCPEDGVNTFPWGHYAIPVPRTTIALPPPLTKPSSPIPGPSWA